MQWQAVCDRGVFSDVETDAAVAEILVQVRQRGDEAVEEYTQRFDGRSAEGGSYEVSADRWQGAVEECSELVMESLRFAAEKIRDFHTPQKNQGYSTQEGRLQLRAQPLSRVGLYVPGGTALYPSSVLMTAIPAQVAGVGEIIMVTPGASVETLAAAKLAGVHRVFEIGGAQAVAALAFGTATIPQVDKIVGPGNQWVASAKRQVFGQVDIDSVAGPSEILILADASANPRCIAADLLAQAEHDVSARAILLSDSEKFLDAVDLEIEVQLRELPREKIARESIATYGIGVLVDSMQEAVHLANQYAPEHLELAVDKAQDWAEKITNAGAIFVGHYTPEAAGDYSAGPNHVLPTGGAARFASPLGVYDFIKYTSVLSLDKGDLADLQASILALTEVEGLHGHGRSVAMRFKEEST